MKPLLRLSPAQVPLLIIAANLSIMMTLSMTILPRVHMIMMMAGSRNHRLGYEVVGSAYDVALNRSAQLYPKVFGNYSVTRYFTPGTFTCADANAITTVGLSTLYADDSFNAFAVNSKEIRIVLSPEENVLVLASTASLDLLNNKKRFPTLLPLASTSYNNVGLALLKLLRLYKWNAFNLVCDSNAKDPQRLAMEVSCGVLRDTFKDVRDISMLALPFDSSNNDSAGAMLRLAKTHSSGEETGVKLASRFFNRTFNLPSRRVELNKIGTRECSVFVKQFNNVTRRFLTVQYLDSASQRLMADNTTSEVKWFAQTFPPSVVPHCGFNGELCSKREGNSSLLAEVLSVIAVICLLITFACWKYTASRRYLDLWWLLANEKMGTVRKEQGGRSYWQLETPPTCSFPRRNTKSTVLSVGTMRAEDKRRLSMDLTLSAEWRNLRSL
ncbi:hypothetical protein BV898_05310 [Hypsibius exemplaris]|uniref:Receptor ligand binding region domain-containing protein n=1 Tax=Hypsibius exemplaris TaxID=2072580 RepID=A0A1W0WZY3_HYPEX|nr:hypothetical protein BV898_05310 [Hypsibius exemplaris]